MICKTMKQAFKLVDRLQTEKEVSYYAYVIVDAKTGFVVIPVDANLDDYLPGVQEGLFVT